MVFYKKKLFFIKFVSLSNHKNMSNQKENEFLMLIAGIIAVVTLAFFMYEEGKFNNGLKKPSNDGFEADENSLSNDLQNIAGDMSKTKNKFLKNAA